MITRLFLLLIVLDLNSEAREVLKADLIIFGATSSGIAAAVQAKRLGRSVLIAEWTQHLGGLTAGGLGATDIGNKAAIGGIARQFYEEIADYYAKPDAWKWEEPRKSAALLSGQERGGDPLVPVTGKPTKWTFEPHVATGIYRKWLQEAGIQVYFGERLRSVQKKGARIISFTCESGRVFQGSVFIDASYEGDLMAKAGVSYHVGRESNAVYNETLNGIRAETPAHQFKLNIDPYRTPGRPESGLLPYIQSGEGGKPGEGDKRVQTYNYRLCMTHTKANLIPWRAPANYDAAKFELLARLVEAQENEGKPLNVGTLMNPIMMPNDKTDTNNNGPFSTDYIGMNYEYPEGDYATRERIAKEHEDYTRAFTWFLATNPRVPKHIRDEMNSWGLAGDEFTENDHFPTQMYVREARRMISDYVMTEANCRGDRSVNDPIALGAYNMDSHNCQRIAKDGFVRNEGDVQVRVSPYGISYRSLVPKQSQCENLLVPICLAASHIAYGSIRMEPVFMILGQVSATAASLALDGKTSVQEVPYAKLRAKLDADHQIVEWKTAPASAGRKP